MPRDFGNDHKNQARPQMIHGTVKASTKSGEVGLAKVRVSNGRDVTLTDESGATPSISVRRINSST